MIQNFKLSFLSEGNAILKSSNIHYSLHFYRPEVPLSQEDENWGPFITGIAERILKMISFCPPQNWVVIYWRIIGVIKITVRLASFNLRMITQNMYLTASNIPFLEPQDGIWWKIIYKEYLFIKNLKIVNVLHVKKDGLVSCWFEWRCIDVK